MAQEVFDTANDHRTLGVEREDAMKNPALNPLEKAWSAAADKSARNFWRKQEKLAKSNRESCAAWLKGMQESGALAANFAYESPAALMAA
jgi:hypothetical protein